MNCVAAVLLFPTASVKLLEETSTVVAPLPLGVNVAVYIVELAALKLLMAPPLTLMSPSAKSVVASLLVKVKSIVASLEVSPLDTVELAIVIVGPVAS